MSDSKCVNNLTSQEFIDRGYLQECNRRFFHPLGLNLVVVDHGPGSPWQTCRIEDHRHTPERLHIEETPEAVQKFTEVMHEQHRTTEKRVQHFRGSAVQEFDFKVESPEHFLSIYPEVIPLVEKGKKLLEKVFSEAGFFKGIELEISDFDATYFRPPTLWVKVVTNADVPESMQLMDQFAAEWDYMEERLQIGLGHIVAFDHTFWLGEPIP